MTSFNSPNHPQRAGTFLRLFAEEKTEARDSVVAERMRAFLACLAFFTPFSGRGTPVSTASALAVWSRLSVRCPVLL